jgi:hypothetical protein
VKQEDYKAMWSKLFDESIELSNRRTELEMDLNEVKAQIQNVEQMLVSIRPLAGIASVEDLKGLGITDAIRTVLKNSKQRLSPNEVRKALTQGGFDMSGYSSPMSSIYTVLGRLASDDDSSEVIREQDVNRNVFYRWKANESTELSDDDIPF